MKKAKSFATNVASTINSPLPTSLAGECKKAAKILNGFIDPGQGMVDKIIPENILANAQGLAIYTVLKAGFLFSGRAGSGIVVARLPEGGWSAPSAIATGGIGAGGQIGAELTDFVLVLNTKEAVKTFCQVSNVTLGGNVSIAAGPLGRNAEASGSVNLKHIAAIYSYSKTRGLFAGVSLEGSVVVSRGDANEKLYGKRVTVNELLTGQVPSPPEADVLYRALNAKFHTLGSQQTYRAELSSHKSTISAPGTLRQPPAIREQAGYGAPTSYQPPPSYQQSEPTFHKRAPPPPPPSRKPAQPTARALYDYAGQQQGDLSFREGDLITIVEKTESQNDWWTGKLNGVQGIFPANYVELQ